MFLSCFVISSPEQLWYLITLFSVCQELFSTFLFFFFAVWPEVLSIFFVGAFVLRCFLNSEVYNTIVLFVCQQVFLIFSKKRSNRKICHLAHLLLLLILSHLIYIKVVSSASNPMAPYTRSPVNWYFGNYCGHMQFLSFPPETRSPPVSPAKSPEICPAYRPEVLLVFSENQTFWSGFHPVSVICLSFPLWLHCLISCTFLPSYLPKNNVKFW